MGGGYLMIKQKSSEMGVSKKEKRGLVITEIFMILLAAVWFIPIYYLIVTTFKNPQEATQSPLGLLGIPELCRCFCKYAVSESIV